MRVGNLIKIVGGPRNQIGQCGIIIAHEPDNYGNINLCYKILLNDEYSWYAETELEKLEDDEV